MFVTKIQAIAAGFGADPGYTEGISENLELVSRVLSSGRYIWVLNLTDSLEALRELSKVHSILTDPPFTEEIKVNISLLSKCISIGVSDQIAH